MPAFEHDGATIHYEEHGQGFPLLCFAPAGLMSAIAIWSGETAPINPVTEFSAAYRVIVMDQRNAPGGRSWAPITAQDGWHSYTADHVALLDHLRIDRCHLYGQCIGGPFIASLLKAQPSRVACAVAAQPTGRLGPLPPGRSARYAEWVRRILPDHPEATEEALEGFYRNMYGNDFLYSVDREFLKHCRTPCLVLAGNNEAHPYTISEEMARLLPDCELIPEWKTGAALQAARPRVKAFLQKHTPAGS